MHRTTINGSRLEQLVGVCATSSVVKAETLEKSLVRFARWGLPVAVADQVRSSLRYLAGTDAERAGAFDAFARDPQIGTIWCARGGVGATRILPLLDGMGTAAALRRRPKLILGYSDVTAIHLWAFHKLGLPTVHAPMPGTPAWNRMPARVDSTLRALLAGRLPLGRASHTADWKPRALIAPRRDTEGVLLGGNLSLVASLCGTPWQPDLRGKILFLEDCAEQPYRVDRMLAQLASSGALRGLRGVLLGDFEADVEYKEARERRYWPAVFREHFEPLGVPVLTHLPVGHGRRNEPLPLGVRVAIRRSGRVELLEQVVKAR